MNQIAYWILRLQRIYSNLNKQLQCRRKIHETTHSYVLFSDATEWILRGRKSMFMDDIDRWISNLHQSVRARIFRQDNATMAVAHVPTTWQYLVIIGDIGEIKRYCFSGQCLNHNMPCRKSNDIWYTIRYSCSENQLSSFVTVLLVEIIGELPHVLSK